MCALSVYLDPAISTSVATPTTWSPSTGAHAVETVLAEQPLISESAITVSTTDPWMRTTHDGACIDLRWIAGYISVAALDAALVPQADAGVQLTSF